MNIQAKKIIGLLWIMIFMTLSLSFSDEGNAGKNNPDKSTKVINWTNEEYGKIGVTQMENTPFPHESRKNGFVRGNETFPYEGHYDDSSVAFVLPKNFKAEKETNIVVMFHGHRVTVDNFFKWFHIDKLYCESGVNAILIVPQGPKEAPDSAGGRLEEKGAFDAFMKEAMEVLKKNGVIAKDAEIENLIVGGFSGGGRVLGKILDNGDMKDKIREVWLIDAAYQLQDELIGPFADVKSDKNFRSAFTDPLSKENLYMMNNLSKNDVKFAVLDDDALSTKGTSLDDFNKVKNHYKGVKAGDEELLTALKNERIVFIRTSLPHDGRLLSYRFLQDFIQASKYLRK